MEHSQPTIELVCRIVSTNFPDEIEVYKTYANDVYEKMVDGDTNFYLRRSEGGHYEFSLEDAEEIIKSISTLISTVKAILEIRALMKKKKDAISKAKTIWKKEMIKNGITEKDAKVISDNYSEDFDKLI